MTSVARLLVLFVALSAFGLPTDADARVPPDFVGMTDEGTFATPGAYRARHLGIMRGLGVRIVRQHFDWSTIERSPGRFDLTFHDRFVLAAAQAGIRVLPILHYSPRFHSRAPRRGARLGAYPPRRYTTFGRFAAVLARRYGPSGSLWAENPGVRKVPIRSWQVWNEPNLTQYWQPRPSAREYVRLLEVGSKALKGVDRRAEVVTAGLPNSLLRNAVPLTRYLEGMYRTRGAKKGFDTLAINSYARNDRELIRLLTGVRRIMNRHGDRRTRIWVTEIGWATQGPRSRFNVGMRGQASRIKRSVRAIARYRKRLRLRGFVYYSLRDRRPYPPLYGQQWGLHTGLLTLGASPKPGFNVFKRAVRRFG